MILIDIGMYEALKGYVINLIQSCIRNNLILYRNSLDELYTLYTEEDINRAITTGIRRTGNKVFMQTSGSIGRILRLLEFGSGRTKALHIITKSAREVVGGRL